MVKPIEQPFDNFQQYYRKPIVLTRKESFKLFLWNPKTQECFGRTWASWGNYFYIYFLTYSLVVYQY